MISKELKCIYIHIPKTAGTSIEKKLGHFESLDFNVQDHRTFKEIEQTTDRYQHLRMAGYALKRGNLSRIAPNIRNAVSPDLTVSELSSFFKFTMVRNTWARTFSWYNVVLRDSYHREKFGVGEIPFSFETFIKEKMNPISFSQLRYIQDKDDNVSLDFIGRFEKLQEDFDIVCERLGIEDSTLPKLLVRNYEHYTDHFTSETKDLVYRLFKDEINYFDFEYGE